MSKEQFPHPPGALVSQGAGLKQGLHLVLALTSVVPACGRDRQCSRTPPAVLGSVLDSPSGTVPFPRELGVRAWRQCQMSPVCILAMCVHARHKGHWGPMQAGRNFFLSSTVGDCGDVGRLRQKICFKQGESVRPVGSTAIHLPHGEEVLAEQ